MVLYPLIKGFWLGYLLSVTVLWSHEKILELLPIDEKDKVPQKIRTRFDKIKPKNKYTLETESDVEEFINELKSKMIEEINSGREITL